MKPEEKKHKEYHVLECEIDESPKEEKGHISNFQAWISKFEIWMILLTGL